MEKLRDNRIKILESQREVLYNSLMKRLIDYVDIDSIFPLQRSKSGTFYWQSDGWRIKIPELCNHLQEVFSLDESTWQRLFESFIKSTRSSLTPDDVVKKIIKSKCIFLKDENWLKVVNNGKVEWIRIKLDNKREIC